MRSQGTNDARAERAKRGAKVALRAVAIALLCSAFVSGTLVGPASAQGLEVQVQVPPGPHYAGDPIEMRVTAMGFEEEPEPEIAASVRGAAELRLLGVSPSVSRSIQIINGRMTSRSEVKFVFRLRLVASEAGPVEVGPLRVTQGNLEHGAPAISLNVEALPTSDELGIELVLPETPIYVGQRVPVGLRFRMTRALQKNIERYTLHIPLFESEESVRFVDSNEERDLRVTLSTGGRSVELPASVANRRIAGAQGLEFSVDRTLIATSTGTLLVRPSSLVVERATGWQRDLFGRRVPARTGKLYASDRERRIEVRDVPQEGRPAGFAGAVGQGYSLEVSADRSVVQAGEPIGLELVLRGGGSLESASLPPLNAPGLLPAEHFRVQDGELAGSLRDGAKHFRTTVRVLDESVSEIPALTYAWFDPTTERFETAQSRPIALSVRPGRRVGADDVVSHSPRTPESEAERAAGEENGAAQDRGERSASSAPSGPAAFTSGADLSIVREPGLLLSAGGGTTSGGRIAAVYGMSLAFLGLGAWRARRRALDPRVGERRKLCEAQLERIRAARSRTPREAGAELADALRRLKALAPQAGGPEFDRVLGDCDALAYAPGGSPTGGTPDVVDPALVDRAEQTARTLSEAAL